MMDRRIHLELPELQPLGGPTVQIAGWCTADHQDTPLTIYVNGIAVEHVVTDRPDVRRAFEGVPSFGFSHSVSVDDCARAGVQDLSLRFVLGTTTLERTFHYTDAALAVAKDWVSKKAAKRAWCREALRCPVCRAGRLVAEVSGGLRCRGCSEEYEQKTSALNMLPGKLYRRFQLKPTGNVSAHPYPPEVDALVDAVRRAGGKVLDCGAGFRGIQDEAIINAEIVDYSSTDVLAVGQSLPFADASFDLALSLAVLEHVDDPFACAAELVRVVKPGGKIFCVVPFMQHEHGYPNHFYNMTRQGLLRLFQDKATLLSHEVPRYGVPIYSLCAYVREYAESLPPDARAQFEQLTIADLMRLKKIEYWSKPYVSQMTSEGKWLLASVTAALFQRNPV
jgi:SAM-dependent methyltransferase